MLPFHHTPDSCYSEKQQVGNQAQFIRRGGDYKALER